MSSNTDQDFSFDDVEFSDAAFDDYTHNIESYSYSSNIIISLSYVILCGMYLFICFASPPERQKYKSFLEIPEPSLRKLLLSFKITGFQKFHESIFTYFRLIRLNTRKQKREITTLNLSVYTTNNDIESILYTKKAIQVPIVFSEMSAKSNTVHLFSHSIDYLSCQNMKITFDLDNPFSHISGAEVYWSIDSKFKMLKTNSAIYSLITLILYTLISFILKVTSGPKISPTIYILILLFISLFAPFTLITYFRPGSLPYIASPFLNSLFLLIFRYLVTFVYNKLGKKKVSIFEWILSLIFNFAFYSIHTLTIIDHAYSYKYHYQPKSNALTHLCLLLINIAYSLIYARGIMRIYQKLDNPKCYISFYIVTMFSSFSSIFIEILYFAQYQVSIYVYITVETAPHILALCFFSFLFLPTPSCQNLKRIPI